jgi:iduronate 2-sulfatase
LNSRLLRFVSLAAWLLAAGQVAGAEPRSKPNVLLIVSDDLRDTVGCFGNKSIKTPNMDRLAARGVAFRRAYAQYPLCNPSRVSFMTGLRCEHTQVTGNMEFFRDVMPEIVTMPQLLRQHGWYAASYGKIYHVGNGYLELHEAWMDAGKSWDEAKMFQPTPAGSKGQVRNLTGGRLKWCEIGAMEGTDDDQPDGQTAQHVIRAIEERTATGKPWFIGAGFHRPHDPFLSPQKYFDLYPPGSMKIYTDPTNITPAPSLAIPGGAFKTAFDAFTEQDRIDFQRAYYAAVSFTDAQLGRVLDTLDRLKLWDNTVIIFTGDNGYHHNERNWWNKNTLFECSCHVPLIIAAPGAKGGQVCHGLVELVDFYPTVADYCGLEAPHKLDGQSLRPLLEDPGRPGKPAAFTLVVRGAGKYGQTVRTSHWRYTRWSDRTEELYDETSDPYETRNLVQAPSSAEVTASLRKLLVEWKPNKAR